MSRGRSGHSDAMETAAESLAAAITQIVGAAVAAALAAHQCGTGEPGVPPALLTYAQASQRLGVSRATLYKLLRAGDIRNVALAQQVRRIPAAELDRYVSMLLSPQPPVLGEGR